MRSRSACDASSASGTCTAPLTVRSCSKRPTRGGVRKGRKFWLGVVGAAILCGLAGFIGFLLIAEAWYRWGFLAMFLVIAASRSSPAGSSTAATPSARTDRRSAPAGAPTSARRAVSPRLSSTSATSARTNPPRAAGPSPRRTRRRQLPAVVEIREHLKLARGRRRRVLGDEVAAGLVDHHALLLRRARRPCDQVDQGPEEGHQDHAGHPDRLPASADVVAPEDVDQCERRDHHEGQEDQEQEEVSQNVLASTAKAS